jgi:hypothetical protein
MIANSVKAITIWMLVIGAVLVFHSAAWCETCGSASAGTSSSCSADSGKPALQGTGTTGAKAGGDPSCNCVDAKRASTPSGKHSLALRAKGGGAGVTALSTFLGLAGLWSMISLWRARRAPLA